MLKRDKPAGDIPVSMLKKMTMTMQERVLLAKLFHQNGECYQSFAKILVFKQLHEGSLARQGMQNMILKFEATRSLVVHSQRG